MEPVYVGEFPGALRYAGVGVEPYSDRAFLAGPLQCDLAVGGISLVLYDRGGGVFLFCPEFFAQLLQLYHHRRHLWVWRVCNEYHGVYELDRQLCVSSVGDAFFLPVTEKKGRVYHVAIC